MVAFDATSGADRAPAPAALLLDRQYGLLRAVCARSPEAAAGEPSFSTARLALDRLRRAGARVGVASHNRAESWDGFDVAEIGVMHERIEAVLGKIHVWCVCLVGADGGCACQAPGEGVVETAAQSVGVPVADCAVAAEDGRLAAAADRAGGASVPLPPSPAGGGLAPADHEARILADVVDRLVVHALDPSSDLRHALA